MNAKQSNVEGDQIHELELKKAGTQRAEVRNQTTEGGRLEHKQNGVRLRLD